MILIGKTHIGKKRSLNEDAIYVADKPVGPLPNLCVVADGMGGHNGGEVASAQSIASFCDYIGQADCTDGDMLDFLAAAATHANEAVYALSKADVSLRGMGTTFTACVAGSDKVYIVHIGDSRVYSLSAHQLKQQTIDHTYINELVKSGQLTPDQAKSHPKRNMLTRVLGVEANVQMDGLVLDTQNLQMLLICSDGLTNMLSDEDIARILNSDGAPGQKAQELVDGANARGGHDNISVVLIDFNQEPTR